MSRYFDDELYHSGVKGMKWKRHKYKLVKDANGKLHYIYDDANNTSKKASIARQNNGNAAARRMQQEAQAKRVLADVIKKGGDPNHSYTVGYTDKNGQHISGKYMPNEKSLSAVSFDKNGKVSPVYSKEAKELMANNKRKYDEHNRQERIRINKSNEQQVDDRKRARQAAVEPKARAAESTARHKTAATAQARANKAQAERSKRIRQAEANRQQVIDRKIKKQSIQAYEDWLKEGQMLDRAKATTPAEKRKNADEYRKHDHRIETVGYSNVGDDFKKSMRIAYYKKDYATGDTSRYTERFTPSKETKKRLRRNKRKKVVSDTKRAIDKGRKAVEEFFKPKKKKKR